MQKYIKLSKYKHITIYMSRISLPLEKSTPCGSDFSLEINKGTIEYYGNNL